jgi:hypothetical protein
MVHLEIEHVRFRNVVFFGDPFNWLIFFSYKEGFNGTFNEESLVVDVLGAVIALKVEAKDATILA